MILSVPLTIYLLSGYVMVILLCMCWFCYVAPPAKLPRNGLSATELNKLPRTKGNKLGLEAECSICLDDIEAEQPARVVPGCNHGFHLQCADTWFSRNAVCPVCRNKVEPGLFQSAETNPC